MSVPPFLSSGPVDLNSLPPPPPELLGEAATSLPLEEFPAMPPLSYANTPVSPRAKEVFPPIQEDDTINSTATMKRSGPRRPAPPPPVDVTSKTTHEGLKEIDPPQRRRSLTLPSNHEAVPHSTKYHGNSTTAPTSPATSPSISPSSAPKSTSTAVWTDILQNRSTITRNQSKSQASLKRVSTYSGRTASLALRGTVLDLSASPFTDFPELRFKEFPKPNLELEKEALKTFQKVCEQLLKERDKLLTDRDVLLQNQQKRDAQIMKDYQAEMNARAQQRLKDFQRQHRAEKKQSNGMSASDIRKESEEFEKALFQDMQKEQSDLEKRLLMNRLKWIMPWFHNMKALELMQYTHLHLLEWQLLEETQAQERKKFEETQEQLIDLDLKGFDKQLKVTMRERKKAHRPMTKEEAEWEKEMFAENESKRVQQQLKQLEEEQRRFRDMLDQAQQKQMNALYSYYDTMESLLLTPDPVPSMSRTHKTESPSSHLLRMTAHQSKHFHEK